MGLTHVRDTWEQLANQNALGAILTARDDWDIAEFMRTGEVAVARYMGMVEEHGVPRRERMLDFGCGVGRLTQAFANHFAECVGVDVARPMVERAQALNARNGRVRYLVNQQADLSIFADESFDLVFSVIVLQHMPPDLAAGYVREFMRVCRRGGAALFQIPHRDLLPPDAWRAELHAQVPPLLLPGRESAVVVSVRNAGAVPWPAGLGTELRLGSRWLDAAGDVVDVSSRGDLLQQDVAPGATIEWPCGFTVPAEPGSYWLEFDVMQKDVGWFSERGSATLRRPVVVLDEPPPPPRWLRRILRFPERRVAPPDAPAMEMHQTARERVVAIVESSGGRMLEVRADDAALPWKSFTYFARKI